MSSLMVSTTIPHSLCSISNNPLQRATNTDRPHQVRGSVGVSHISCIKKQTNPYERTPDQNTTISLDRRNLLVGLGGLYSATTTMGNQAIGAPIQIPDLSKCHPATDVESGTKGNCCPPYTNANIIDFKPPSSKEPLRIRKPAHKYDSYDIAKFEAAIAKMKALPEDDPWSYKQQATIHCTYCNGAFNQVGTDVPLQVHASWIFLPWHRYYIYFWERILGKLIGDPTFAIPFWNWDTPKGMYIPEMYLNKQSPLYDAARDTNHYSSLLDYKYAYNDPNPSTPCEIKEVIIGNMCHLNSIFKESIHSPTLFMGKKKRAGEPVDVNATVGIENLHNVMHQWVGPPTSPYHDMGDFFTAGFDTIFFGHHGNVDRMWDLYSGFRGHKPEFNDSDWLNSEFMFYDENRQVVKVKVKDCLKTEQLGYTYTQERLPWVHVGRQCRKFRDEKKRSAGGSIKLVPVLEFGSSPRTLTETIQVLVPRPTISRSKRDKEDASEVLVIKGIGVAQEKAARFDVYITKPMEGQVGPDQGEYVGSFVKIPHFHVHRDHSQKSSLELGITVLLEDIEAEDSKKLVVTLVPRHGDVTIDGIGIELFSADEDD